MVDLKWIFHFFPIDILSEIQNHVCAMCIQTKFRRFMFRHVQLKSWSRLRSMLCKHCSAYEFALLSKNEMVRHEWRTESESWIFVFHPSFCENDKIANIKSILKEVVIGEWSLCATCRSASPSFVLV